MNEPAETDRRPTAGADSARRGVRRRPRGSLSLEQILDAAQAVVEADGRDALTMRRVADRLGAGTMSLYGYVDSKEDIWDHLAARILGSIPAPASLEGDDDWRPALRRYFLELRATLVAHPEFQRLFAVQGAASRSAFVHAEAAFAILSEAGITGPRAARVWFACMTYTVGFVLWELPRLVEAASSGGRPTQARRDRMTELPRDRFTFIPAMASVLATSTSQEQFEFGLDALMAGSVVVDLSDTDG